MSTFPDDYVRIAPAGTTEGLTIRFVDAGIEWPPPETFEFMFDTVYLVSASRLTDEQRAGLTGVARGALYRFESELTPDELARHGLR